jgi:hypothetical protein
MIGGKKKKKKENLQTTIATIDARVDFAVSEIDLVAIIPVSDGARQVFPIVCIAWRGVDFHHSTGNRRGSIRRLKSASRRGWKNL